ncbi:hypothetical protein FRUB_02735 [Fimbriiglobus ruber]|uniref:Response regulatory domain-containing protein n=1 Tax=Fimbriiglobus ruber TaxID=1908690 RepID=A0A225DZE9_9BACT|nr:hypothetical protein FRUB_02735 [Fimbriiglobus ruber]
MQWGLKVLVVGDRPVDTEPLALVLEALGSDVEVTSGGTTAVELAQLTQPHVVIIASDLANADRFGVVRDILDRAKWRKPLVVALTAKGDVDAQRRYQESGVHLTAERPVNADLLCGLLRRFRALLADIENFDPMI